MFRWIVLGLGACLVVSATCVFGWFVSRTSGRPDIAIYFAVVLKYALFVMAAAAIYSAAVGAYHTFLSVTGLDQGGADGEGGGDAEETAVAASPTAAGEVAPSAPDPTGQAGAADESRPVQRTS